ncbi:MAG: carbon-nitrogen hydrolase family protein [Planctomycetota bacterium]
MADTPGSSTFRIAVAQIAPVFLDREATLAKIVARIAEAADRGCAMVCFGETIVPGYPVWLDRTGGARFDDPAQKRLFAHYLEQAVVPEEGHLEPVCAAAARGGIAVVLGIAERAADRGGHSIYCSRLFIDAEGAIASVHRKLMPTYEERLVWGAGDGAGLVTHPVGPFRVGALNCWENWMPLARAALYAAGESLHVALWPGARRNTGPTTRFLASEGRSYAVSVSGLLRARDVPADVPMRDRIVRADDELLLDGGSAVAGPDGRWLIEPVVGEEALLVAELDPVRVREERQNFDAAGHYARPDVLHLTVDRRRQTTVRWIDPG